MRDRDAEVLFREADSLFRSKRFEEALAILDELDAAFPSVRHIMVPRARSLAELGRYDEALALCDAIIHEHNYVAVKNFKARIEAKMKGDTEGVSLEIALDALDALDADDELTGAFAQAPVEVHRRGWGAILALTGVVGVALVGMGIYFQSAGRQTSSVASEDVVVAEQTPPRTNSVQTSYTLTIGGGKREIDHSVEPERVTIKRNNSQDGVTVNSSIEYGIWTDSGSYNGFLAKFAACEPAAIRMMALMNMIFEYRVLGYQNGSCQIEMTIVEIPMFEDWGGKSMICPCDNTEDFITVTEQLGLPSIMDGTLQCEGALFDAMVVTAEKYQ